MKRTNEISLAAAVVFTFTAGLAIGCAHDTAPVDGPCDGFSAKIDELWGKGARRDARAKLEAFAGESQADNVDRLVEKMDKLTSDWVLANRRACKSAKEKGTMPAEIYAQTSACLDNAFEHQRALIDELAQVDQTSYGNIDRAMLDIAEQISICSNRAVLAYYKLPEETVDADAAKQADAMTAKARVLIDLGRRDEATRVVSDAAFTAERSGDARREIDAQIAGCHHNVLLAEYDQALSLGKVALEAAQGLGYATGEADVLTCTGTAHLRKSAYEDARRDLEAALSQREAFFGSTHPRVADAANRLGELETAVANYRKAHDLFMRALDIWSDAFGVDDPTTSEAYHNLGYAHIGLEDIPGAAAWYQKAISAETASFGKDHPATALSEARYAAVLLIQERPDEAYELLNHAVEVQEKILGPGNPEIAISYQGIGEVWAARKGWDVALEWYTKALTLRKLAFGERHLDTARTLDTMARAYYGLKKYDEALEHATTAMETREALLGPQSIITAESYSTLGKIYEKKKKVRKAIEWHQKALTILEAVRGEGHDLTNQTRQTIDRLRGL